MTTATTTHIDALPVPGYRPIPLLRGRADLLRFFSDPIGHLLRLQRRFGAVAALTAGDPSLVCAFGAEHNRAVLSDPASFRNFVQVPFPVPKGSAATRMFSGIMSMNGDEHRRHRRLLMPVVNKAAVSSYGPDIVRVTEQFLARWSSGQPVDVMREMAELTGCVLMRCLFDVDATTDTHALGHLSARMLGLFSSPLTILFPVNLPGSHYSQFLAVCERVEATLRSFIRDRGRPGSERRDVLSILLRARDDDAGGLTEDEVIAHTVSMVFAGQDTVANALAWTLLLLSQHPDVLADLDAEVDAVLRGAPPTADDLTRLPLLDAVVNESMRLLPAIVHLLFRQPTADRRLGPYRLPAGSLVILSPLVTHRDPDVFPDPLRFHPGRWSTIDPGPYEYLPYGAGPRMCIGSVLAAHMMRTQLAMILQRYRPTLEPGVRVDCQVRAATLGARAPVPLRFVDRRAPLRAPESVQGTIRDLVRLRA
jgi:cytochrome P450